MIGDDICIWRRAALPAVCSPCLLQLSAACYGHPQLATAAMALSAGMLLIQASSATSVRGLLRPSLTCYSHP